MGAGGDIEENHLVRSLPVIAEREFHRVADIAQTARFGTAKLHAAGHLAVMDIEAGDDTFD